ncbi:nuclear transport factor 2 family protein [Mesorhizobium sp. BR1-1-3]|uniref:nuclear transport factor 2 family protein n=1 Tax=Mesorhizobium sp. BR1-1-3 TaxID=2876651 RepID=UPI001CD11635|nr:nuclear transport factor 2 family protein [Mesorhizobium sp. BR1-1-3]MBZ9891508.1 nuclear transport factor 2 family protein [Mesorhizobium sp. BR1-1-3]
MNSQLTDIEQVRRAKARYCRFVDTRDLEQFASLLEPTVEVRVFSTEGELIASFDDRESYMDAMRSYIQGSHSIHQLHNDEIDQISQTEITAIWSMEDVLVFPGAAAGLPARIKGYGHYHELWRLGPYGWRLARMTLRRAIFEVTNA